MSPQDKLFASIGAIAIIGMVLYIIRYRLHSNKLLRQKAFYHGSQERDKKKNHSFWLPLFLYRRRQPNGKVVPIKNIRSFN